MNKLSDKQLKIMAFPFTDYSVLICEGSVRSGKSSIMTISFIDWAMREFNHTNFIIAGKTVGSCIKNIVRPYLNLDYAKQKYQVNFRNTDNMLIVKTGTTENYFMVYGGKDERSQDLIQGLTAGGAFLDEVALMPQSFVNQATARCSMDGSRLWFNCNPEHPEHLFYKEWIQGAEDKNALLLHFTMQDNPSLSEITLKRYDKMYSGVFHDRFIKGLWVRAEGLIYQQYADKPDRWAIAPTADDLRNVLHVSIGIDFGGNKSRTTFVATAIHAGYQNITVLLDHAVKGGKGEIDSGTLARDLIGFVGKLKGMYKWLYIKHIFADSAEQYLITGLRKALKLKHPEIQVHDSVKHPIDDRIRCTATMLNTDRVKISTHCTELQDGLKNTMWDSKHPDKRLDDFTTDIDIIDAFEYSWEYWIKKFTGGAHA